MGKDGPRVTEGDGQLLAVDPELVTAEEKAFSRGLLAAAFVYRAYPNITGWVMLAFVTRCLSCRAAGRHITDLAAGRQNPWKAWISYKSDCRPSVRLEIRVTLGRVDVLAMHTWCLHSGQQYS